MPARQQEYELVRQTFPTHGNQRSRVPPMQSDQFLAQVAPRSIAVSSDQS
jgi:hypothetical protein